MATMVGLRNGFEEISRMGVVGCSNWFGHCSIKMEGTFDEDGFKQDGFEQEKKGRKRNRVLIVAWKGRGRQSDCEGVIGNHFRWSVLELSLTLSLWVCSLKIH